MTTMIKITTCSIILTLAISLSALAWPIPDTGQTKCYDNEKEISCPSPERISTARTEITPSIRLHTPNWTLREMTCPKMRKSGSWSGIM